MLESLDHISYDSCFQENLKSFKRLCKRKEGAWSLTNTTLIKKTRILKLRLQVHYNDEPETPQGRFQQGNPSSPASFSTTSSVPTKFSTRSYHSAVEGRTPSDITNVTPARRSGFGAGYSPKLCSPSAYETPGEISCFEKGSCPWQLD